MYEDVSRFLRLQEWMMPETGAKAAGNTWIELFVKFDIGGYRRKVGKYKKNTEVAKRAEARRAKVKRAEGKGKKKSARTDETAETRASLGEELECFKKICRFIGRQDMSKDQEVILKAEKKQMYYRLKGLAIIGHQAGIQGVCRMDAREKLEVEEAIFRQKYGTSNKALKAYLECKARNDDTVITIRKTRGSEELSKMG